MKSASKLDIKTLIVQIVICLLLVSTTTMFSSQFNSDSDSVFVRVVGSRSVVPINIVLMTLVCLTVWLTRLPTWVTVAAGIAYYLTLYAVLNFWVSKVDYEYCINPINNGTRDLCGPMLYSSVIGGIAISLLVTVAMIFAAKIVLRHGWQQQHRL
jgi:hypothetical protein